MAAKIMSSFTEPAVSIATEMPELCFFRFCFPTRPTCQCISLLPSSPLPLFQACTPPRIRPEGLTFYCHVLPLFPSHERPSEKKFPFCRSSLFLFLSPSLHNFPPPSPSLLSQLEKGALHCFRRWLFSRVYSQCDKTPVLNFQNTRVLFPFIFLYSLKPGILLGGKRGG